MIPARLILAFLLEMAFFALLFVIGHILGCRAKYNQSKKGTK